MGLVSEENMADTVFVERARQGDAAALDALIERHYGMLFRVAFRWCGQKENAEDIAQEACIKIARHIDGFGSESSFTTWAYRIVINTAKDFHKSRRLTMRREEAFAAEHGSDVLENKAEEAILCQQVYAFMDTLPLELKKTALLVFAEELSHKEAASVLGCAEATVSWRIHKIKKKLNGHFGK